MFFRFLLVRFGKCPPVHLLVLIQRNLLDLHDGFRDHVGWFLLRNKLPQSVLIKLCVRNQIGGQVLPAGWRVESLYGGIRNTRELTDDFFHLRQLDAEPADLNL